MFFGKHSKKSFYKIINKYYKTFNLANWQLIIFYQFIYIVVYNIDILYLILIFRIFYQKILIWLLFSIFIF